MDICSTNDSFIFQSETCASSRRGEDVAFKMRPTRAFAPNSRDPQVCGAVSPCGGRGARPRPRGSAALGRCGDGGATWEDVAGWTPPSPAGAACHQPSAGCNFLQRPNEAIRNGLGDGGRAEVCPSRGAGLGPRCAAFPRWMDQRHGDAEGATVMAAMRSGGDGDGEPEGLAGQKTSGGRTERAAGPAGRGTLRRVHGEKDERVLYPVFRIDVAAGNDPIA